MAKKAAKQSSFFDRAKKQVEAQMKRAEDENRRSLIKKRVEFMTTGVKAYEKRKFGEAVVNYQSFIRLLEGIKGVGDGGLTPSHFDPAKEMGDLLMLVGVYWDLAKLFDKTDTPERVKLFSHYLEKFILFSKGMSWQPMCAELLRRYLLRDQPKHKTEFKNAYKLIGSNKCFIANELSEEIRFETLPILWEFRDEKLQKTPLGRQFIRRYYQFGPIAARLLRHSPKRVRHGVASGIDRIALFVEKL